MKRIQIFWYNYQIMRVYGNGVPTSIYKGIRLCQGKKVRVHPGRRRDDSV